MRYQTAHSVDRGVVLGSCCMADIPDPCRSERAVGQGWTRRSPAQNSSLKSDHMPKGLARCHSACLVPLQHFLRRAHQLGKASGTHEIPLRNM